jgi:hypothetical protein
VLFHYIFLCRLFMRLTIHNENHVRQNQINPLAQCNDPGVWEPDTTSKP